MQLFTWEQASPLHMYTRISNTNILTHYHYRSKFGQMTRNICIGFGVWCMVLSIQIHQYLSQNPPFIGIWYVNGWLGGCWEGGVSQGSKLNWILPRNPLTSTTRSQANVTLLGVADTEEIFSNARKETAPLHWPHSETRTHLAGTLKAATGQKSDTGPQMEIKIWCCSRSWIRS